MTNAASGSPVLARIICVAVRNENVHICCVRVKFKSCAEKSSVGQTLEKRFEILLTLRVFAHSGFC